VNAASALRVLMRLGGVKLDAAGDARRVHGGFPAANAGAINGEWKENVGIAQHVVVKEIPRAGAEIGDVNRPTSQRNGQVEFVLLIPFAAQGQKGKSLLGSLFP
jgi:hypothetical protein